MIELPKREFCEFLEGEVTLEWNDQGWGNQKGKLWVKIAHKNKQSKWFELTSDFAPHVSKCITAKLPRELFKVEN